MTKEKCWSFAYQGATASVWMGAVGLALVVELLMRDRATSLFSYYDRGL